MANASACFYMILPSFLAAIAVAVLPRLELETGNSAGMFRTNSMAHEYLQGFSFLDGRHDPVDGHCLNIDPSKYADVCGKPRAQSPHPVERLNLDISAAKSAGGICSQWWQDRVLAAIYDKIGTTNKYFLEFGARRPQILNSAHFRLNCQWNGLLLDGAPGATPNGACPLCADLSTLQEAPDDAPVRLRQAFLTKENVNQEFERFDVPKHFDMLTIDIDRNDYWILKGMDFTKFQPRVVAVEFSSRFGTNEPKEFAEKFHDQPVVPKYEAEGVWKGGVTGSSLSALHQLMQERQYSYVGHVAGEHAIWVRNSELNEADRNGPIPDRVDEGWMATSDDYSVDMYQAAPLK